MTPSDQTMTRAQFADHLGVSRSYITKLANTGRLVLAEDGRINVAASQAALKASTGAPERAVAAAATEAFADWRERKERAQAEMAEMDVAVRRGTLMQADQVRAAAVAAVTMLRSRLELLPDQLAPQLAATSDELRVKAIIAAEVEAALAELSTQFRDHLVAPAEQASAAPTDGAAH